MGLLGARPHTKPKAGCRRLLALFGRERKGSVAIEFAALIIPFSLLMFAIIETSISFAAQQLMSNAADDVARQIRTGQWKQIDVSEDELKERICNRLQLIVSDGCSDRIEVDLRQYDTFAEAADENIVLTADDDIDTSGFAVSPGPATSINMLRVFYRWPVMTDFMRKSMSSLKDGNTLHYASVTWQNEPFGD